MAFHAFSGHYFYRKNTVLHVINELVPFQSHALKENAKIMII